MWHNNGNTLGPTTFERLRSPTSSRPVLVSGATASCSSISSALPEAYLQFSTTIIEYKFWMWFADFVKNTMRVFGGQEFGNNRWKINRFNVTIIRAVVQGDDCMLRKRKLTLQNKKNCHWTNWCRWTSPNSFKVLPQWKQRTDYHDTCM